MVVDNYDKPSTNLLNFHILYTKLGLPMIKYLCPAIILLFLGSGSTFAETDTATELQHLQAQLRELTAQVKRLEQRLQAESTQNNNQADDKIKEKTATETTQEQHNQIVNEQTESEKPPRIRFTGDMRVRYQYDDYRDNPVRDRTRIRLRLAADTDINESTSLYMRLATGADNPTSANATLDGGFSRKDFGLDRAYVKYEFTDYQHLLLGKMKNPYNRVGSNGMLFDSDLNPEGLAWKLSQQKWHGTMGAFYVDERKNEDNIMLYAAQFGLNKLFSGNSLQLGFGYYDYDNLQGAKPIYQNSHLANRTDNNNQLLNDFNIAELYAQYDSNQFPRLLSIYTTYLNNTAADNENEAYLLGFKYGSVKKPNDWQFGYNYQYTEADAVFALFKDSGFSGGYTDSRSHNYQFVYGLSQQMSLTFTWIDAVRDMHLGTATEYDRITLDVSYWFK